MNKKIHLIIPMGGAGSRFAEVGFKLPKPLIEIHGKPFLYWSAKSIIKYVAVEDLTFVVLQEHVNKFKLDEVIKSYFPEAKIVIDNSGCKGAVTSCMEAMPIIKDDLPLVFNDCDHLFKCQEFYDFCNKANFNEIDGAMLTFTSNDPKYSYLKYDNRGNVIYTVEKEVVSNQAICGVYYFKNKELFDKFSKKYLDNCNYKEFFMSGIYNVMANQNKIIKGFNVDAHVSFGTPEEFDLAVSSKEFEVLEK